MPTYSGKHSVLKLRSNEIHLWMTLLHKISQGELLSCYRRLLTTEELRRQQEFVFDKKRHSALVTRAFIRDLLSHYADISPEYWRFKKGPYDKPELVDPLLPLSFNLSHTDDLVICAVTLNDDIGCDVEMTNKCSEFLSIAKSHFSGSEYTDLLKTPAHLQQNRFFDYWTLKESYIKALGKGLSIPLADFSFYIGVANSRQYNDNIILRISHRQHGQSDLWRNWLFHPNSRYRIAVSVKAQTDIRTRSYSFRYFDTVPLVKTRELNCVEISL